MKVFKGTIIGTAYEFANGREAIAVNMENGKTIYIYMSEGSKWPAQIVLDERDPGSLRNSDAVELVPEKETDKFKSGGEIGFQKMETSEIPNYYSIKKMFEQDLKSLTLEFK